MSLVRALWGRGDCSELRRRRSLLIRPPLRGRRVLLILSSVMGLSLVLLSIAAPPRPRLVWNASSSAPTGLYLVIVGSLPRRGDMMVASVPAPFRRLAAGRRYLPMNVPLVKRVGAVEGDKVCAAGKRIYVAGKLVAQRLDHDAAGRKLPTWNGCVVLGRDQFLLLTSNPASFDGRYFGLTSAYDVIGKAKLIWPS